eukprot:TRINITY_DN1887_c0_g1_i2.p1 TRINITY_DN1887_c0_g1~~TRINITY_DN1887_c0_g1_i2.p1  ORF type:complete len:305 (-),score=32.17 TRINITY_DN1887_c0_g1_i2:215-1129(-)
MYDQHIQPSKIPSVSVPALDWEYPFIAKAGHKPPPQSSLPMEKNDGKIHQNHGYPPDNRWQSNFYERETIWGEIRLYSDHLRRYASESPHPEVTREKFFEIYNLAVGLLRAIDCLDPDYKMRKMESVPYQHYPHPPDFDYLPRRPSEFRRENPNYTSYPPYNDSAHPYYPQHHYQPPSSHMQVPMKNLTGEVFFDDLVDSERYPKRKRKKPLYSVNRNLYCHICFVRETPEWRRGPDGDHTLCNACGLHYAKTQKKEKLAREGRKHSIDMLLNESSNGPNNGNSNNSTPPSNNVPQTVTTMKTE